MNLLSDLEKRIQAKSYILYQITSNLNQIVIIMSQFPLELYNNNYDEEIHELQTEYKNICKQIKNDLVEYFKECNKVGAPVNLNFKALEKEIDKANRVSHLF